MDRQTVSPVSDASSERCCNCSAECESSDQANPKAADIHSFSLVNPGFQHGLFHSKASVPPILLLHHAHKALDVANLITAFVGSGLMHAMHLLSSLVSGHRVYFFCSSCCSSDEHCTAFAFSAFPYCPDHIMQTTLCRARCADHTMQSMQMPEHC